MKKIITILTMATILTACGSKTPEIPAGSIVMETSQGQIVIELSDKTPITSGNFRKLVQAGFYDGLSFHRYVPSFVIQGGDPLGNGRGGADEDISLEIPCVNGQTVVGQTTDCEVALPHDTGVVAMARSDKPDSASSQFYFTLAPQTSLDGKYAVFGKVIMGMDVVQKLRQGDTMTKVYEQK